jgi:cytolysin (calcineurin-like family phosphatase)
MLACVGLALALVGGASCVSHAQGLAGGPDRDVTFLATSDCHYKTAENDDMNVRVRDTVRQMNEIAGVAWPEKLGGGAINRPRAVLVLGDILDDGDRMVEGKNQGAEQWKHYLADFGLDGTDGLLKYPVFEGVGNHDGPPAGRERYGFSYQAELKGRNVRRREKGWLTNLADNRLHYSWDWDDVHFVQLNLYPADRQHAGIKYSPAYHDPQGALTFLKQDLQKFVGRTGRPVVLLSHCGFDTDWWHAEDWQAAYDAAKPYKVVLYMYGHTGTGLRQWKPEREQESLSCVNTGQTENGFFVVQLLRDRLRLAYRVKQWTEVKTEGAKPKRTWDGTWQWKHLLEKKIAVPAAGQAEAARSATAAEAGAAGPASAAEAAPPAAAPSAAKTPAPPTSDGGHAHQVGEEQ